MRYLGVDLGSRRIGLALSGGIIAQPYKTISIPDADYDKALALIVSIIDEEAVTHVVIGYPKHMNGDVGEKGQLSEKFRLKLLQKRNIDVILWDERLSTVSADKMMIMANVRRDKRKEHKDEIAAVLILQGFLDKQAK